MFAIVSQVLEPLLGNQELNSSLFEDLIVVRPVGSVLGMLHAA